MSIKHEITCDHCGEKDSMKESFGYWLVPQSWRTDDTTLPFKHFCSYKCHRQYMIDHP